MEDVSNFMSKADKLLGLDDATGESKILVQKAGFLHRQQAGKLKGWKKLHFVVKDGFLLWYNSANDDKGIPFDTKPKGVLPLGGSIASLDPKDKRHLEIKHPDIAGANFRLRAADVGEATDWLVAIEGGKKATWENALLGNALVEKMKTTGTKLEEEKEAAFQALQEKAARLEKEREQAGRLMQRDAERQTAFRAKLEAEKNRTKELEGKRSSIVERLTKEEEESKNAARQRLSVERKLAEAELALEKLEEAMIVRSTNAPQRSMTREDTEVHASVTALRAFFEARANEQAIRAKALYERLV